MPIVGQRCLENCRLKILGGVEHRDARWTHPALTGRPRRGSAELGRYAHVGGVVEEVGADSPQPVVFREDVDEAKALDEAADLGEKGGAGWRPVVLLFAHD